MAVLAAVAAAAVLEEAVLAVLEAAAVEEGVAERLSRPRL